MRKQSSKPNGPQQLIDSQEGPLPSGQGTRTILTDDHRMAIARLILENKCIIQGSGLGLEIKADKQRVWQQIFDHVISLGGVIPNVRHLRKVRSFSES